MRKPAELCVVIPGESEPQGSTRAFVVGKRAVITSDNKNLKAWRARAAEIMQAECRRIGLSEPWDEPVRVWLTDYRLKPKSVKRAWPSTKPDLDKIVRATLDALTQAGVIRDDSRVCEIEAYKCYAKEPHLELCVYRIIDRWSDAVTKAEWDRSLYERLKVRFEVDANE